MSKQARYTELLQEITAIIDGETSMTARYATAACVLHQAFDHFFWTGFYLVDPQKPNELVVGPYQGTLGCLRIPFGKGVCGTSAEKERTILVEDVHAFPGHIACDARSNSEIVVPVFSKDGQIAGVLDVDSTELAAFDAEDQAGLEAICKVLLAG